MKKRILITSTDLMMVQFLIPHVKNLVTNGYEVDVACSDVGKRFYEVCHILKDIANVYIVRLVRSPFHVYNIKGLKDIKRILEKKNYDLVWTNEPVVGVMTRIAAKSYRGKGTKILYMVHGFHFYKGAPAKMWILFYPIEKLLSRVTDVIVTMNEEDYERAQTFNASVVEYIHGIGVDIDFYESIESDKNILEKIGVRSNDFCLLNVGELSVRKNQKEIIEALAKTKNKEKIKLVICGVGPLDNKLKECAKLNNLSDQVIFMGYRKDIGKFYKIVDGFIFPSLQEGLSRAVMEAMVSSLPVICSKIRGNVDLIDNNGGIVVDNAHADEYSKAIDYFVEKKEKLIKMGEYNKQKIKAFDFEKVSGEIRSIINREIG